MKKPDTGKTTTIIFFYPDIQASKTVVLKYKKTAQKSDLCHFLHFKKYADFTKIVEFCI